MSWLENMKKRFHIGVRKEVPGSIWIKCEDCGTILFNDKLKENLWVCNSCDFHFRIIPDDYIRLLLDEGTFSDINANIHSIDFLKFRDVKKYADRIKTAQNNTNSKSAIRTGTGMIFGRMVAIGIMDFRFIGGSLGSVVGEKIIRLIDMALEKKLPLIIIPQSGGARMQESSISLMQMAKTSAAIGQYSKAGLPYIVILTNPTTGGVTASFAMLGDIHIAEPKALIGFAGPRVIKEAMKCELPDGFQKSDFLLEHGFCDMIVSRKNMKREISKILNILLD
ncbi:MAG: acetyl-CoA carboxylase carboxyltransferase subunit beta [Candidatus Latescibacteria bacterium]|jgi:acetyl-CoA carboxylase carboxyl transferase subunit beta|nr:acetyl-CoA carboxylase carboxyltransferase subunit beta [Candidatus Latescibacterota bacterium]